MKSLMLGALCAVGILAWEMTHACTLPAGYGQAEFRVEIGSSVAAAPQIRLHTFVRGFDDGDTESCSRYGELSFVIDEPVLRTSDAYRFDVLSGALPGTVVPDALIEPIELGDGRRGFVFRWRDVQDGSDRLEAIDAIVTVRSVSQSGAVSAATAFRIQHAGGSVPTIDTPTTALLDWVTVGLVVMPIVVLIVAYGRRRRRQIARLRLLSEQIDERRGR